MEQAVDVLCDATKYKGVYSYLVSDKLSQAVKPGVEVLVPFGDEDRLGVVLGYSSIPNKANKEITKVTGVRILETDFPYLQAVADFYLSPLWNIAKDAFPNIRSEISNIDLTQPEYIGTNFSYEKKSRHSAFLLAPGGSLEELTAYEAYTQSKHGQVLVVCPTIAQVDKVLSFLPSGAYRLDSKASEGAWESFLNGELPIGIGTRKAALYSAKNLKSIIIVDEGALAHKSQSAPYAHTREISKLRARYNSEVELSFVSKTPSPYTLAIPGLSIIPIGDFEAFKNIVIVNQKDFHISDRAIPPPVDEYLRSFSNPKQVPVVLTPFNDKTYTCTACKKVSTSRNRCSYCNSTALTTTGWNPKTTVARYGLDLPLLKLTDLKKKTTVPGVIIPEADMVLSIPSFVPYQVFIEYVVTALDKTPKGKVFIYTSYPKHPLLSLFAQPNTSTLDLVKAQFRLAKENKLPPFTDLIKLQVMTEAKPNLKYCPAVVHGPRKIKGGWELSILAPLAQNEPLRTYLQNFQKRSRCRVLIN